MHFSIPVSPTDLFFFFLILALTMHFPLPDLLLPQNRKSGPSIPLTHFNVRHHLDRGGARERAHSSLELRLVDSDSKDGETRRQIAKERQVEREVEKRAKVRAWLESVGPECGAGEDLTSAGKGRSGRWTIRRRRGDGKTSGG